MVLKVILQELEKEFRSPRRIHSRIRKTGCVMEVMHRDFPQPGEIINHWTVIRV
jgi:hypothetical protein